MCDTFLFIDLEGCDVYCELQTISLWNILTQMDWDIIIKLVTVNLMQLKIC